MLKKFVVSVLACIALFLSQRALTESQRFAAARASRSEQASAGEKDTALPNSAVRTSLASF